MATKDERFVVHEHYVVDTKLRRFAPMGEPAGAGVVCDQCNANAEFARVFVWMDGDPRPRRPKSDVGRETKVVDASKADERQREEPAS